MSLSDILDDAADVAVTGRTLDPAAILARAERPEYRPQLRPLVGLGAPRWRPRRGLPVHPAARGLLVAASVAAAVTLVLALLPVVQRAVPVPATTPKGPGGIPRTISTPPPWLPTLTERPISRAVYVGSARVPADSERDAGMRPAPDVPWVVGADGGQYRALPVDRSDGGRVRGVALSPDGTRVAWTSDSRYGVGTRLDVVDVRTGAQRTVTLPGSGRRGFSAVGLAFSPDGAYLALWGYDRLGPQVRTARLTVVDAVRGRVAQEPCDLDTSDLLWGAAWLPSAAEPRLNTRGCTVGPRDARGEPIRVREEAVVETGTGLPPIPTGAAHDQGLGTPTGAEGTGPVLSPDGATRWTVVAHPLDGPGGATVAPQRFSLEPTGRTPSGVVPLDLGAGAGAIALAAVPDGVVVTRWSAAPGLPSAQFGPSDVVLARPDGTVETLTTSADDQARVAAVASAVVAAGRAVDGTAPGPRVLDLAWWSSLSEGLVHKVPAVPAGVLVALGAGVVGWGVRKLRTKRHRRIATTVFAVVLVTAVLGPAFLPSDAPRVPPDGANSPAVPAVLRDQRLVPPPAFDTVGRPRTTAVGIVFRGTVAGRPGLYATDAATAALVRLDDLPGLGTSVGGWWPANVTVSPNGRWLSNGGVVVDLRTARWGQIPGSVPVLTEADGVATNTAVLDDGSVVLAGSDDQTLWAYPPPTDLTSRAGRVASSAPRGTRVAGVEGAVTVTPAGPGRVVVGVVDTTNTGDTDTPASRRPTVLLVDVGSPGSGASPGAPRVTPLSAEPGAVVAVLDGSRVVGDEGGWIHAPLSPSAGPVSSVQQVATAGAVDAVWLAAPGGVGTAHSLVVLGAGAASDLVVSRTAIPVVGDAAVVSEVTTIDPAVVPVAGSRLSGAPSVVTVAAEVVAGARVVDPPDVTPWWSWAVP